jgi:hypothetical protein
MGKNKYRGKYKRGNPGGNGNLSPERAQEIASLPRRRYTDKWWPQFIAALRDCGNIRAACEVVGIDRRNIYYQIEEYEDRRQEFDEAMADATDILEAAAIKRAQQYSDTLLMFLLKARRPQVYRDNYKQQVEISGPGGKAVEIKGDYNDPQRMVEILRIMDDAGMLDEKKMPMLIEGEAREIKDDA